MTTDWKKKLAELVGHYSECLRLPLAAPKFTPEGDDSCYVEKLANGLFAYVSTERGEVAGCLLFDTIEEVAAEMARQAAMEEAHSAVEVLSGAQADARGEAFALYQELLARCGPELAKLARARVEDMPRKSPVK